MIQARQMLRKYSGRAHQRVGRHRHLRRVHRRPRRRRRRPGRRRRRRLQPAEHPHPGPRHRAAAAVHRAADGQGPRDPRRRRRRHQLRADAARAADQRRPRPRRGPRRQHRLAGQQPADAGRRRGGVGVSRTATISSRWCCASTRRTATRRRWATLLVPAGARQDRQGQRRRDAEERLRAGVDRPLQPAAPDFGEREPAGRAARRSARRRARSRSRSCTSKPGYQAVFGGSARTLAEASSNFAIALVLAVIFIYMVLASQFNQLHPPADDHDGAAAQPPGRRCWR